MRILKIVHRFPPESLGGAELYAYRLSHALQAAGHEVSIVYPVDDPARPEYDLQESVFGQLRVFTINRRRSGRFKRLRRLLFLLNLRRSYMDRGVERVFDQILGRVRPDVAHVHHLLSLSITLMSRLKACGVPVVITLHDYWFICWSGSKMHGLSVPCESLPHCGARCLTTLVERELNLTPACYDARTCSWWRRKAHCVLQCSLGWLSWFLAQQVETRRQAVLAALNQADRLLAPSQFLRRLYLDFGVDAGRIHYLDHGTEAHHELVASSTTRQAGTVRFGFLGRLAPEKGLHVLIEAFNELSPFAVLKIYGCPDRYIRGYEEYVRGLARHPGIQFQGAFAPERIMEVLGQVDVVVVPSVWRENSPLVIHEAFMAGVPVIAADTGGVSELVRDRHNGLLFPVGNVTALRTCMEELLRDPQLFANLKGGIPPVKTMRENVKELLSLYEQVARSSRGLDPQISRGTLALQTDSLLEEIPQERRPLWNWKR